MTTPTSTSPGVNAVRSAPSTTSVRSAGTYDRHRLPTSAVVVLVVLGGLLGGLAGALFGANQPASYSAHAYVLVAPSSNGRGGDITGSELAQAYARIGADPGVAGPAFARANLPSRPQDIAKSVTSVASPDAPVIDVIGKAPSGQQAALFADTAAHGLIDHVQALNATPGFKAVLLTGATVPDKADGSPLLVYTLLGLALGLGICAAIAALRRS